MASVLMSKACRTPTCIPLFAEQEQAIAEQINLLLGTIEEDLCKCIQIVVCNGLFDSLMLV